MRIDFLLLLLILIAAFSCSDSGLAGATSETTNGAVAVADSTGTPLQADIFIRPRDSYITDSADTTQVHLRSDAQGRFIIPRTLAPGSYLCEISSGDTLSGLAEIFVTADSSADIRDSIYLSRPADLSVYVNVPQQMEATISVFGLGRFRHLDSSGPATFSNLPAGTYPLAYSFHSSSGTEPSVLRDTAVLKAGETTILDTVLPLAYQLDIVRSFMQENGLDTAKMFTYIDTSRGDVTAMIFNRTEITTIPGDVYTLPLRTLSLAHNNHNLNISPAIGGMQQLRTLDLSRNNIDSLPPEMAQLQNCMVIDLEKNTLKDLPRSFFEPQAFPALLTFDITDNYLADLANDPTASAWLDKYASEEWIESQYGYTQDTLSPTP
ncbi:MAG: leucine-rich repeat domain-containing protein [Fibrobacterota bacterium]